MDEKLLSAVLAMNMKLKPEVARDVVRTIFDTMAEGLVKGETVYIYNFATLFPDGHAEIGYHWFQRIKRKGLLGYSQKKGGL